jgi:hypothetical protein
MAAPSRKIHRNTKTIHRRDAESAEADTREIIAMESPEISTNPR